MLRSVLRSDSQTYDNIFDALSDAHAPQSDIDAFRSALEAQETGSIVFQGDAGSVIYTFAPIESMNGWHILSIVPLNAIQDKAIGILRDSQMAVGLFALMLVIISMFIILVWHIQKEIKEKEQESAYRSQLFEFSFTFLAENTDDLYIILDHETEELEYASPNLDRVLGVAPDELIGYLRTGDMAVDAEGASAYYSKLRVCIQARWRSRGVRSGSTPKPVNTSIFWRMFTALTFRAVKSGYDRRNLFEGGRAWHVFVMYSRGKGMVAKLCVEKNSTCADHHPQKSYCPP